MLKTLIQINRFSGSGAESSSSTPLNFLNAGFWAHVQRMRGATQIRQIISYALICKQCAAPPRPNPGQEISSIMRQQHLKGAHSVFLS